MRERIDERFQDFARFVVRNRWLAIVGCLALALSLASQLPKMTIETAVEKFLDPHDPALIAFLDFREQFGREDIIILAVRPPDVFDLEFLTKLRDLHEELEQRVPHVDDISSMVNARATYGSDEELIVEDLLEEFPQTPSDAERLRARVIANPLYLNTLISEQAALTTIVITMNLYSSTETEDPLGGFDDDFDSDVEPKHLSGPELWTALDEIEAIIANYQAPDFPIVMAGSAPLQRAVAGGIQRDLPRFVAIMLATVMIVLFVLFRRLSGVILPIMIVVLALVSTLGALAASGTPLTPPTQILPTFLLAVGTGAAVHVLKIFYRHFDDGDSAEDALARAFRHSGFAILMTGLTTAGGLLSFLAAGLVPIEDIGRFAPLGILLALIYCMVLLPALLTILPLRRHTRTQGTNSVAGPLDRLIVRVGDFSVRNPRRMVGVAIALIAVSLAGATRIGFSNDILSWISVEDPLRKGTAVIDRELRGSITLELLADTGRENGVKDPAFLAQLAEVQRRSVDVRGPDGLFVGKTISVSDIVKEIHQALNENRPDYYAIPNDAALVAQELLLFENTGTDDLEDVVDTQFQLARVTLKVPYASPMYYDDFTDEIEALADATFDTDIIVTTTGFMGVMGQTVERVVYGMANSYMLALAIITPLMIVLLGSLRGGLVAMVPNLTPILLTLGIMGWLEIRIDTFTMMVGGIAIGLAVDDTIHFIHSFQREFARLGDARAAVRETLETTGRALLVTSIVLAGGFLVFTFSSMQPLFYFGALTSFTIVAAFVIDIAVTPALLVLVTGKPVEETAKIAA